MGSCDQSATGSDQRTPLGVGNIQLVAPFVVRYREAGNPSPLYHQAGVARLTLHFLPEPTRGLLFVGELLALGALYRLRPRCAR